MPWKTILRTINAGQGGTLEILTKAIRAALGLGQAGGVDRAAFTAAVVALSAKLSKSDGVTLKVEEETFERLFHFEPDELANVRWLFGLASQDTAGFESYAREVAATLAGREELKLDVFEALLHIATADGVLHEGEDRYLKTVADIFGYSTAQHRELRSRFVQDETDPYTILGMNPADSDEALKSRYRDLVRTNHPDALAGKGLSKELQDLAARKLAAINVAWEAIVKERNL